MRKIFLFLLSAVFAFSSVKAALPPAGTTIYLDISANNGSTSWLSLSAGAPIQVVITCSGTTTPYNMTKESSTLWSYQLQSNCTSLDFFCNGAWIRNVNNWGTNQNCFILNNYSITPSGWDVDATTAGTYGSYPPCTNPLPFDITTITNIYETGVTAEPINFTAPVTADAFKWFESATNTYSGNQAGTGTSFVPPTATVGTMYYYCIAYNGSSCETKSSSIIDITVTPSLASGVILTVTPSTANINTSVALSAVASNISNPTYNYYVKLPGQANYQYVTSPYYPPIAGTYSVKVEVVSGADPATVLATDTKTLTVNLPTVTLTTPSTGTAGIAFTLSATSTNITSPTYKYYVNGVNYSSTYTPLSAGSYTVKVEAIIGGNVVATNEKVVTVVATTITVKVQEFSTWASWPGIDDYHIYIDNLTGTKIFQMTKETCGSQTWFSYTFPLGTTSTGMFIIIGRSTFGNKDIQTSDITSITSSTCYYLSRYTSDNWVPTDWHITTCPSSCPTPTPPIPSVSLTVPSSPYNVNTQFTLSAVPTNITNPVYKYYVKEPGQTSYQLISGTTNYTPATAGTYYFKVEAAETTAPSIVVAIDEKPLTVTAPPSEVALNVISPAEVNVQFGLSATPTNITNPKYKYYVQEPGQTSFQEIIGTTDYTPATIGTYYFKVEAFSGTDPTVLDIDVKKVEVFSEPITVTVRLPKNWLLGDASFYVWVWWDAQSGMSAESGKAVLLTTFENNCGDGYLWGKYTFPLGVANGNIIFVRVAGLNSPFSWSGGDNYQTCDVSGSNVTTSTIWNITETNDCSFYDEWSNLRSQRELEPDAGTVFLSKEPVTIRVKTAPDWENKDVLYVKLWNDCYNSNFHKMEAKCYDVGGNDEKWFEITVTETLVGDVKFNPTNAIFSPFPNFSAHTNLDYSIEVMDISGEKCYEITDDLVTSNDGITPRRNVVPAISCPTESCGEKPITIIARVPGNWVCEDVYIWAWETGYSGYVADHQIIDYDNGCPERCWIKYTFPNGVTNANVIFVHKAGFDGTNWPNNDNQTCQELGSDITSSKVWDITENQDCNCDGACQAPNAKRGLIPFTSPIYDNTPVTIRVNQNPAWGKVNALYAYLWNECNDPGNFYPMVEKCYKVNGTEKQWFEINVDDHIIEKFNPINAIFSLHNSWKNSSNQYYPDADFTVKELNISGVKYYEIKSETGEENRRKISPAATPANCGSSTTTTSTVEKLNVYTENRHITITSTQSIGKVYVYNVQGQAVYINHSVNSTSLSVPEIPQGIYILRVITKNNNYSSKIVVL